MASFLKTPVRILKIGQITKLNNYVICNTQIHSLSALKTQTFSFVRNYQWVKALFEGKESYSSAAVVNTAFRAQREFELDLGAPQPPGFSQRPMPGAGSAVPHERHTNVAL